MSENTAIHREAFWTMCGRVLNSGIARTVYECRMLPECVVKVEDSSRSFQNVMEWEAWSWLSGQDAQKWFAPCRWISPSGAVLIMARTTEPTRSQYPERMPAFLGDFKRTNYGLFQGRLVCHDYGTAMLMVHGLTKRMRKAEWWDA